MSVNYSNAPDGWTSELAEEIASNENIQLTEDHWNLIAALQEYYVKHENKVNFRELHDALDECFHTKGGVKYLYSLIPSGPVTLGCKLAGLESPPGAVDKGFGTAY